MLERSFEEENKLEPERKTDLAKKLGLQPRQVAVWFQNRRARWKTKTLERDYDRLKSSYDILTSDFDSIVKENEKLKAEVLSLTEKLQPKDVHENSGTGQDSAADANEGGDVLAPQENVKLEDHFSTGSGGSAVVDDLDGPQLVDSGDSYFPDDDYPHEYVPPMDQSEEDDGSDDGHKHFPYMFATADHHHHEENDALGCLSGRTPNTQAGTKLFKQSGSQALGENVHKPIMRWNMKNANLSIKNKMNIYLYMFHTLMLNRFR